MQRDLGRWNMLELNADTLRAHHSALDGCLAGVLLVSLPVVMASGFIFYGYHNEMEGNTPYQDETL